MELQGGSTAAKISEEGEGGATEPEELRGVLSSGLLRIESERLACRMLQGPPSKHCPSTNRANSD